MSQLDFDCLVVFPRGIISNKNTVNANLALIANNLETNSQIICPAQIWYYLEDFPCSDRCICILPRNPDIYPTLRLEIVEEVKAICQQTANFTLGVIAHPDDQDECMELLSAVGIASVKIDCSTTVI